MKELPRIEVDLRDMTRGKGYWDSDNDKLITTEFANIKRKITIEKLNKFIIHIACPAEYRERILGKARRGFTSEWGLYKYKIDEKIDDTTWVFNIITRPEVVDLEPICATPVAMQYLGRIEASVISTKGNMADPNAHVKLKLRANIIDMVLSPCTWGVQIKHKRKTILIDYDPDKEQFTREGEIVHFTNENEMIAKLQAVVS